MELIKSINRSKEVLQVMAEKNTNGSDSLQFALRAKSHNFIKLSTWLIDGDKKPIKQLVNPAVLMAKF